MNKPKFTYVLYFPEGSTVDENDLIHNNRDLAVNLLAGFLKGNHISLPEGWRLVRFNRLNEEDIGFEVRCITETKHARLSNQSHSETPRETTILQRTQETEPPFPKRNRVVT